MKKYIKQFPVYIAATLLTACNDFLDTKPSDYVNDPLEVSDVVSKYASVADAEAELNGAYSSFKTDIFQFENFFYNDIQSDNCYVGGDGFAEAEVDDLRINSMNEKNRLMWSQYYAMAGTATSVIENTRLLEVGISEDERKRIMAEGKFIRAYAYFDIVRIWGDAPLMTELIPPITADNLDEVYPLLYPPRTDIEEIYDVIIKDLEDALPGLPSKSQGYARATKGSAYGLLAKVHATRGEKASRNYQKVVDYCDDVIAEGYQLMTDFDDLWKPENNFTTESILEYNYTMTDGNWAYWVLYSEEDGSITWRRYATPTHELISKYSSKDKRFASTVVYKSVPYDTYFPSNHYPIANKIRSKESNVIFMRLADILLLKAEALVELNKPGDAIQIVNVIRERAGLDALDTGMSQPNARLAVENERQLELALEAHRWFDLLRNDRMIEVMSKHKGKNGNILFPVISGHRTLWPVPQNEKDTNPNLTQNEGY